VILHRIYLLHQRVGRVATETVHCVAHPDTPLPEGVEHGRVGDGLVGPDGIDPSLLHEITVAIHKAGKVKVGRVRAADCDGVPIHALEVERLAVHQELATRHGDVASRVLVDTVFAPSMKLKKSGWLVSGWRLVVAQSQPPDESKQHECHGCPHTG